LTCPDVRFTIFPYTTLFRSTLTDRIEAIKDYKMSYANMRLIDEMCKNESYGIHALGYIEDLEHIDSVSISEYYQTMLKENMVDRSEEHTSELQSRFDLVCRL